MRAFIVALALVSANPALACHRFRVWKYPTPQRCGTVLARAPARIARLPVEKVNVEITLTPELLETWARQDALDALKSKLK